MMNSRGAKILSMVTIKPGVESQSVEEELSASLPQSGRLDGADSKERRLTEENTDGPLPYETRRNINDDRPYAPLYDDYDVQEDVFSASETEYFPSETESDSEDNASGTESEKFKDNGDKKAHLGKHGRKLTSSSGDKESKQPNEKAVVASTSQASDEVQNKGETSNTINEQEANQLLQTEALNVSDGGDGDTRRIYIRCTSKDADGKRKRDKCHCCLFCNKLYKELSKHQEKVHANEGEVAKVLAMPTRSDSRRNGFIMLARAGDYYHNCEVLKTKNGELILARIPTPEESTLYSYKDYGPCPDCLGFMIKKHLWHHLKYACPAKSGENSAVVHRRRPASESTALLIHTVCDSVVASAEFTEAIIGALKDDMISLVCKQDRLIMNFGSVQFEKYGTTQSELIRQSMRQLGRLLLELRRIDPNVVRLSNWLDCNHFDTVILAVKNICRVHYIRKMRPQFQIPSLALKLGYSIRKCIAILKSELLRQKRLKDVKLLSAFNELMDIEWANRVSSNALATLTARKMNATELLPMTEDLIKLNKYLDDQLEKAGEDLTKSPGYSNWSRLASVVLCKIVLFNKRRSGEASRITVLQYSSRPIWSEQGTKEFCSTFTDLEKKLASRLTMVQITGKRGRTVSVLLTDKIKKNIDSLLDHRGKFVLQENPYLFARSKPSMEHIRGHDCLRKFCDEALLIHPELVTATKLRKYIATVCQVFDLTETETDWLARHLGHDIRVHRDFYRLHHSSIELTKVSRILMAIENGDANTFKGKKLDEINIRDLPDIENEDENECNDAEDDVEEYPALNVPSEDSATLNAPVENSTASIENSAAINVRIENVAALNRSIKNSTSLNVRNDNFGKKGKTSAPQRKVTPKKLWSEEESAAVFAFFRNFIKGSAAAPGKALCNECIENSPVLSSRSWKDVKYFVYNYKKKICKRK